MIRDWLPVLLVLIVYDLTRGKADEWLGISAHIDPQLALDRWLGLGEIPTLRLQHCALPPGRGPVVGGAGHPHLHLALLRAVHRGRRLLAAGPGQYWRYIRRFVTLSFAAAVTFVLFPAVPPWLACRTGRAGPDGRGPRPGAGRS